MRADRCDSAGYSADGQNLIKRLNRKSRKRVAMVTMATTSVVLLILGFLLASWVLVLLFGLIITCLFALNRRGPGLLPRIFVSLFGYAVIWLLFWLVWPKP
jgi:hypothetical protein